MIIDSTTSENLYYFKAIAIASSDLIVKLRLIYSRVEI